MTEAVLDPGQLAHGEEDGLLDLDLFSDQNLTTVADANAVDADEFDFQLDGNDDLDDDTQDTEQPDTHNYLSADTTETTGNDAAESEIGYEDEDAELGHSDHAASHQTGREDVDSPEDEEEIHYDGEISGPQEQPEPASLRQQPAGEEEHPSEFHEDQLEQPEFDEGLEFDPELAGAADVDQLEHEDFQVQGGAADLPGSVESGREYEQPQSKEGTPHTGEGDSSAAQRPSGSVDVTVIYNKCEYELCAKEGNDDPDTFFFAGHAELDYPLSRFLSCLREVIADEVAPEYEILVRVSELQLEFGEVSLPNPTGVDRSNPTQKSTQGFLDDTTFRDILDLYKRLQANDGVAEYSQPAVELLTRLDCSHHFSDLLEAAEEGTGLVKLHSEWNRSELSGSTSPVDEGDTDDAPYEAPTEEREQEAEHLEDEKFSGYEEPSAEQTFSEETLPTDAAILDMMAGETTEGVAADSAFNLQEEVEQSDLGHTSGYLGDNTNDVEVDLENETHGETGDVIEAEIGGGISDEAEDEIDYREPEDLETNVDAANVPTPEQQAFVAEEHFTPYTNITSTNAEWGYDNEALTHNPEEALGQSITDEVNSYEGDEANEENENQVEDDLEGDALQEGEHNEDGDGFVDEIGAQQADAASAPTTTGNDPLFISPLKQPWRPHDEVGIEGSSLPIADSLPSNPWSADDDLIDYSDEEELESLPAAHKPPAPKSPLAQMDDGLIDYSDDEASERPSISYGAPSHAKRHAPMDEDLIDYSDDDKPAYHPLKRVCMAINPQAPSQSRAPWTSIKADANPVEGFEENVNVYFDYDHRRGCEFPDRPATKPNVVPGYTTVHVSSQKAGEDLVATGSFASQTGLELNCSGSQDHQVEEYCSTKQLPTMNKAPEPSTGDIQGRPGRLSVTRCQRDEDAPRFGSTIWSPDVKQFTTPSTSRHGSPMISDFTFSPTINADWPYLEDQRDSIAHPDTGFGLTAGSTHDGEHEQTSYDHAGQDEYSVAVEGSSAHDEAIHTDRGTPAPSGQTTHAAVESPTSTIKGDEINYEDDQGVEDDFDVDLHDPTASGQSLDEIDWDQDGDDDKHEAGVEDQDPNILTSSNGSAKKRRQSDGPSSLVDESG